MPHRPSTARASSPWLPVRWFRDHPMVADALLGAVLGIASLVTLFTIEQEGTDSTNRDPDVLGVLLVVGVTICVAHRRRAPVRALWASVALIVPFWVLDYVDAVTSMAALVLIYSVAAHVDRPESRRACLGAGGVLTAITVVGIFAAEEQLPPLALVGNVVIFASAYALGESVRNRRAYLAEVEARAERAEREREAAADRAVEQERVRIARELHDVVAHAVSVMVVQAGAGRRVLHRSPELAEESLRVVESTGRDALTELRRMLGVLRDDSGTTEPGPQPDAAAVDRLVGQFRDAGLDVELQTDGDLPDLDAGVGLTVYRVVQEALTNAMKHAGPAAVEVLLRFRPDAVTIVVTDDGRGPHLADPALPSSGQGLIGMRERVELFGGRLTTGRRPGGGFQVRAELPTDAAAPAAT